MKKAITLALLLFFVVAGHVQAGQYRIAPPRNQRKRPAPANYRESRLEIVNEDDRGYAIDVDYRRNRLTFVHRAPGDIFVAANSRATLVFDDDDNWHILGDHESLEIVIRSGRTTTLRLDTKKNRHQVGLFGTVESGGKRYSKQLFKYADRPGRGKEPARPTPTPSHRPPNQAPHAQPTPPPRGHQNPPPRNGGKKGPTIGKVIDHLLDNDGGRRR